ncbi:MAG: hypothetical protein AAFQ94_31160, partial [Bacteroidota bacterium]
MNLIRLSLNLEMPLKLHICFLILYTSLQLLPIKSSANTRLFQAYKTLELSESSLKNYFNQLKQEFRVIDHYEEYINLTEEIKKDIRFSSDQHLMNLVFLFEADFHSVTQHQGLSLLAVQRINFDDPKL